MADPSKTQFDVIVVGSGASGGWAAKRLSEAGLEVAMLEAGRPQSDENFTEHMPAFKLKYRDMAPEVIRKTRPVQKDCYACMEYNYDWFANDLDEPYTTPDKMPFSWQGRLRITGGRTNVWGRQSYRLSDLDFKGASHDGFGEDWPLSYKDVAPYYDVVEEYVGITGMPEGVYELPDGKFQPPMGMTCAETLLRNRVKAKLGRTITLGRSANITRSINGRAPCHYCGPCERGCVTHSYFNSAFTTVADALATGKCTHISNAMVYKVLMDADRNRASGILYIDRDHKAAQGEFTAARWCCARRRWSRRAYSSTPPTSQFPAGLANSSGVLGHYLMDHITGGGAGGQLEGLPGQTQHQRTEPSRRHLRDSLSEHARRPAVKRVSARLRISGRRRSRLQLGRAGIRTLPIRKPRGPGDLYRAGRLRRMLGALGQLRRDQQESHRHFWHSGAERPHDIQRQ